MNLNRKGVVAIAVILYAVAAFIGGALLAKPVTNMFGISNEAKKHQEAKMVKKESKPVLVYTDEKGREHIAMATSEEYSNSELTEQPKQTFWQKIQNLGSWGIFLVILGFLFPPVGVILTFIWKKVSGATQTALANAQSTILAVQAKHEDLSADAKLIVLSIDDGLAQINKHIEITKNAMDLAQTDLNTAGTVVDPVQRQATIIMAQQKLSVAQSVYSSVMDMKEDFKNALKNRQDQSTKLLVEQLKNS
jgi:hypothetical protein